MNRRLESNTDAESVAAGFSQWHPGANRWSDCFWRRSSWLRAAPVIVRRFAPLCSWWWNEEEPAEAPLWGKWWWYHDRRIWYIWLSSSWCKEGEGFLLYAQFPALAHLLTKGWQTW